MGCVFVRAGGRAQRGPCGLLPCGVGRRALLCRRVCRPLVWGRGGRAGRRGRTGACGRWSGAPTPLPPPPPSPSLQSNHHSGGGPTIHPGWMRFRAGGARFGAPGRREQRARGQVCSISSFLGAAPFLSAACLAAWAGGGGGAARAGGRGQREGGREMQSAGVPFRKCPHVPHGAARPNPTQP